MTEAFQQLKPMSARRLFVWQMAFFAALLALWALVNAYSEVADLARLGRRLPLWEPMLWELSSHLLIWLLIPAVGWWLAAFPLARENWWRSLPAHVLATAPFSVLHTGGMILVRKLVYRLAGEHYNFGPFWDTWLYEYRKDFVSYWVVLAALLGFRAYGLWLETRVPPGRA